MLDVSSDSSKKSGKQSFHPLCIGMRNDNIAASPVYGQKEDERAGRGNLAIPHTYEIGRSRVRSLSHTLK